MTDADIALSILRKIGEDEMFSMILTEDIDDGGHFVIDTSWIDCTTEELALLRRIS